MTPAEPHVQPEAILETSWRLDPERSHVRFQVPHFWGLKQVNGHLRTLAGDLDLRRGAESTVELRIDATSVETNNLKRDRHLRSADFFDATRHPEVVFAADRANLSAEGKLHVTGKLQAAGRSIATELDATISLDGRELQLVASTTLAQRELGMTWSPLGMVRPRSQVMVLARLVPAAS